jgi:KipI family sensor histidine kinase inhibitor
VTASARLRPAGDRAVLVELADNREAHAVAAAARRAGGPRVSDVVVGHRTVLVVWREPPADAAVLAALRDVPAGEEAAAPAGTVTIPVRYDGPDLADVARLTGLSEGEVAARHAAASYRVAFTGFAPGFGYLLGGDPRLAVPRRDAPRERVPPGAVALAGPYSAVYPSASPGGWQLIGTTPLRMFDPAREPPALLAPGSPVVFEAELP